MRVRRQSLLVLLTVSVLTTASIAPVLLATTVVAQSGDGGSGSDGGRDGPRAGGRNVSVDQNPNGSHSVRVRNVAANQTLRVRFRHRADAPVGIRVREMTMTPNRGGDYRLTVRTAANASAGVQRFTGPAPFGYINVTHAFSNRPVSNVTLTCTLNRSRLRERNVSTEDVALFRYHAQNRSWNRLQTRVREQNATHVTYRAASPGLSEFAVAPTTSEATETVTPTPTATDTPTATSTPTQTTAGDGSGFGPVLSVLALLAVVVLARRT